MDDYTHERLMRRFGYIFDQEGGYPAICDAIRLPPLGTDFSIDGPSGEIPVSTFDQDHGEIRSVGYRIGDVAYSSDVVDFPPEAIDALSGLKVWIVDALRPTPHPTHAHLALTLEWISKLRPERAILTNMHMDLDYRALADSLPAGVEPAYDGLTFDVSF